MASREQILEKYNIAKERIRSFHLRKMTGVEGPVCLISTAYPGVWLEHAYDGLCYGRMFREDPQAGEIAKNHMRLFLNNQREDGRLPFNVLDASLIRPGSGYRAGIGYRQIQECVSFGSICYDVYKLTGDRDFLKQAFEGIKGWDKWLCEHRMTMGKGLIEMFCLFDTGHDNSARFAGIPNGTPDENGCVPANNPALPILAADMNSVFFGNRMAVSNMAAELGLTDEAEEWKRKAEEVKAKMMELLWDDEDAFMYDMDCHGNRRTMRTCAITNVFSEHVLTQEEFDRVYEKHMLDPEEFNTPFPIPSVAYNSGCKDNHAEKNSWGYFSQALTALRGQMWMDYYGRGEDYDRILAKWVDVYANQTEKLFTQEIDPITGEPTDCSRYYSSAMLTYIYAVDRLKLL